MQLDLFPSPSPPSSSALTAPSSALSPIIEFWVQMPRGCRACGSNVAIVGSSCGPHAARLTCTECGIHAGWMGAREVAFITKIATTFGRPTTPIVAREWRHV
jgi:hypothetical protein